MAKFLTFETTAVKLNDSIFPSNMATFGLQAATVPVFDINGNLIDYAPNGPIQGKFSTEFYLTGALPDYLKFDNQSDAPISVSFNNFNIPSAFLTDLSFSVEPYQPISVSVSFDFYHGILSLDTNLNDTHNLFSPADGTNKVKNKLATLNGLSSYILTNNRSTYAQNPDDFIVSNFNYSFTVDRQPLLRVKQSIPSRVAMKQVNGQFSVTSNNIDGLLDVHGNDAIFSATLVDSQNLNTYTSIGLTGIITDQNYVISDSNYGVGTIKMVQNITKKRNIISIPFGTNDPEIVEISPPVLKIFTPTPLPPVRPNPIPPPTPPPKIVVPPTFDPNLIWFNIYANIPIFKEECKSNSTTLSSKSSANVESVFIDGDEYIIKFLNFNESIKITKIDNYFICSIGVNQNILDIDPNSPNINLDKPFNEFLIDDPCFKEEVNDPNSILNYAALTVKYWDWKYEEDACARNVRKDSTDELNYNCPLWRKYSKWSALIQFMRTAYTGDKDSSKEPYEIILSIIS